MSYTIRRTGNVAEIVNGIELMPVIKDQLYYWHKTFYRGQILQQRNKWLRDQRELRMLGSEYSPLLEGFNPKMDIQHVPMFHISGNNIAFPAGLVPRIQSVLNKVGIEHVFNDLRKSRLPPADFSRLQELLGADGTPFGYGGGFNFKYKQDDCLRAIDNSEGGIINCPTGYGKSELAVRTCKIYPKSRIAFISPGLDTIKGLAERLTSRGFNDVGICGGGHYNPDMRITLASADSIHKIHLSRQQLIMYDEVHTCTASRQQALSEFTEAKFIGFSANFPGRGDGTDDVIESIFGPLLIHVPYYEAVENAAVAPIKVLMIETPKINNYENNPDSAYWKRKALWRNKIRNETIAWAVNHVVPQHVDTTDPQILAMVETIDHAYELRKCLPDFELVYKEPASDWDERHANLLKRNLIVDTEKPISDKQRDMFRQQFEKGELKRAIATFVWKAGVNFVDLPVFVWCAGGNTEISNTQGPGRLSRLSANKKQGILIDLLDRFDPKAEKQSLGRMKDYRRHGWQIQIIPACLPAMV